MLLLPFDCAQTDELIGMPFGAWSRVGQMNRVLGEGSDPSLFRGRVILGGQLHGCTTDCEMYVYALVR